MTRKFIFVVMYYFRSIFSTWWILLIALYTLKQPAKINYNNLCDSSITDEIASLHSGDDAYLLHEYLIPGGITTGGYDVKNTMPDIIIPHRQGIPEVDGYSPRWNATTGYDHHFFTRIIIFPFHVFW